MAPQDRRKELARRLALWSIADQIDHESVDKEVAKFASACSDDTKEFGKIQEQMAELKTKQKEIAKRMIVACCQNIHRLQEKTANSVARPLVDLAFWNRMSDLDPDLYKMIHPHLDEIGDEKSE